MPRTPPRWPGRLVLGAYLAVAGLFCLLLVVGVGRELWRMRPPRPSTPEPMETCVAHAERLRGELLDRLAALPTAAEATDEVHAFQRWSVQYRARALAVRARCIRPVAASADQAAAVREAFDAIVRLLDQSEVQAAHWARHVGPALDRAASAVERARVAQ